MASLEHWVIYHLGSQSLPLHQRWAQIRAGKGKHFLSNTELCCSSKETLFKEPAFQNEMEALIVRPWEQRFIIVSVGDPSPRPDMCIEDKQIRARRSGCWCAWKMKKLQHSGLRGLGGGPCRAAPGVWSWERWSLTSEFSRSFRPLAPHPLLLPCKASRRKDKGKITSWIELLGYIGPCAKHFHVTLFYLVPRATLRNTQESSSHFAGKETEFLVEMGLLSFRCVCLWVFIVYWGELDMKEIRETVHFETMCG